MPYKCEKVQNMPITLFTAFSGWDWATDLPAANAELKKMWDESDIPMIHISNFADIVFDLDAMIKGTANIGFGPDALFAHPNLKESIIVTAQESLIYAVNQMNSAPDVYHTVPMRTMPTLKEALSYAREQF